MGKENKVDAERRIEELEDVLYKIKAWVDAYPVNIFPEPTKDEWKKATEIMDKNGFAIANFSLGFARHVLDGIKQYLEEVVL